MADANHVDLSKKSKRDQRSPKRTRLNPKKCDSAYWLERLLTKGSSTQECDGGGGSEATIAKDSRLPFFVRMCIHGERHEVCLETADKCKAASRATDLYELAVKNGWVEGRKRFEAAQLDASRASGDYATYGDVVDAHVRGGSGRRATRIRQGRNLLLLVSSSLQIEQPDANREKQAFKEWEANIRSLSVGTVTNDGFVRWRSDAEVGEIVNPKTQKPFALSTINRKMRQYKAVFGRRSIAALSGLVLPKEIPGVGLSLFKVESSGYIPNFEPEELLAVALEELYPNDLELYKIVLLCLVFGLRRGEADRLTWNAFDLKRNVLKLSPDTLRRLKSKSSEGELPIDPDLSLFLRTLRGRAKDDEYVIRRPRGRNVANRKFDAMADRNGSSRYRANSVFNRLISWLRGKGVNCFNPIHQLRKAFGWDVCIQDGIQAACEALRHSNIRVTYSYYTFKKARTTSSLSKKSVPRDLKRDKPRKEFAPDEGKLVQFEMPADAPNRKKGRGARDAAGEGSDV